jgi:topoisomerase-4 subunit A
MVELEPGALLTQFAAGEPATRLVIGTQFGLGFITTIESMMTRQRAGKQFMTIERSDLPSLMRIIPAQASQLAMLSAKGRLLIVGLADVKVLPTGGRGVLLIDPEAKADGFIDAAGLAPKAGLRVFGAGRAGKPAEVLLEAKELKTYEGNRARRGKLLELRFKPSRIKPGS